MEKSKKVILAVIITGGLVALAAFMLLLLFSFSMAAEEIPYENENLNTQEEPEEEGLSGYDAFAQCLAEKGVKMYGASWCGHCTNQKLAFGESWQYVDYVECSTSGGGQAPECAAAGIRGYPTWVFPGGEKLSGERSFEELSQKSGCELP